MRMRRLIFLVTLLVAAAATAEDSLHFSGFGTLTGAWFSSNDADFTPNTIPYGPGRSKSVDFGLDSRIGGQIDIDLGHSLKLTAQAIMQRQPDRRYTPQLSLAHIRWQTLEKLAFRAGRMQDNSFLASEYRLANLSNPWVRPPPEVYGLIPLIYEDGVDANWGVPTGLGLFDFSLSLSRGDFDVARSNEGGVDPVSIRRTRRLVARWQNGNWLAKASWGKRELSYHPNNLQMAIDMISLLDPATGKQLDIQDTVLKTWTLGLSYDSDDWLFMAEWARRQSLSAFADGEGAYFLAGHRFGKTMPYFVLARRNTAGSSLHSSNSQAEYIIDQLFTSQRRQNTSLSLGLNHALTPELILRAQIDFIRPKDNSWGAGPYNNHSANYNFEHPPIERLISLGLDFVF